MDVIVKGQPSIDFTIETKVVDSYKTADSALSSTSENPVMNKVVTERFNGVDAEVANRVPFSVFGPFALETTESLESHDVLIEDLQNTKIDKEADDYYPQLSVGLADNLVGHEEATASEIGAIRRSGGGAILDGNARIESIKGNSVVWNNSVDNSLSGWGKSKCTLTMNGEVFKMTITADGNSYVYYRNDAFIKSLRVGHKYLRIGSFNKATTGAVYFRIADASGDSDSVLSANGSWNRMYRFFSISSINSSTPYLQILCSGALENEYIEFRDIQFIDLTKMFGAGNEPTTIEEFYARCPIGVDEYAYNEGEVIHCNVDAVKSVGRNVWDEEWELGRLSTTTGNPYDTENNIRTKNFIPILPNTDYYKHSPQVSFYWHCYYDKEKNFIGSSGHGMNTIFRTPANAFYLKTYAETAYGTTYNNDICINLSDSSINGQYFPYIAREQSLEMAKKYFPNGMRSAGTAHDEIRYNKVTQKWEAVQRIAEVDLGTLAWSVINADYNIFAAKVNDMNATLSQRNDGICIPTYPIDNSGTEIGSGMADKSAKRNNGYIYLRDTAYTDAATLKAAMQGVMLYYELAEPIVTEIEEDFNLDYQVWNFGTEQAIADTPSAPIKADTVYGFNAVDMIREHESEITALQEQIAALQTLVASLTSTTEE